MDNLQGVRVLIDRLGLPPRMKYLVTNIELETQLETVGDTPGGAEVRRILGMVDGQNLCAAIVASILNAVPVHEIVEELAADKKANDDRTPFARWSKAAEAHPEQIVLLLHGASYIAFDAQAERLADELEDHMVSVDKHNAVSLQAIAKETWTAKLIDLRLDVLLVEEDEEGGYLTFSVLEDMPTE